MCIAEKPLFPFFLNRTGFLVTASPSDVLAQQGQTPKNEHDQSFQMSISAPVMDVSEKLQTKLSDMQRSKIAG